VFFVFSPAPVLLSDVIVVIFVVDLRPELPCILSLALSSLVRISSGIMATKMEETKYVREGLVQATLEKTYAYKDNYTTTLADHEFIVYPDVFNPEVCPSPRVIIDSWLHLIRTIKPDSLLEIGAGAGYLSVLAALNGANRVTATDVTPQAFANIQANIDKYNLGDRMRALCGNVFEPLDENSRFDIVFWSLPLCHIDKPLEELNPLERTLFDPGYGLAETYIKGAHKHLTDKGRLFTVFSNKLGNFKRMTELANNNGWRLEPVDNSDDKPSKSYDVDDAIDFSIYELLKV
jgi:release factor glutamine methyltransferase